MESGGTFKALGTDEEATVTIKVGEKEYTATLDDADVAITNVVGALNTAAADSGITFAASADGAGIVAKLTAGAKEGTEASVSVSGLGAVGLSDMSGTINPDARNSSITQYNEIMEQINQLAADSSYKGVNLLKDGESLKIVFNEDRSSSITVQGKSADVTGLGLKTVSEADWSTNDGVDETITAIEGAVSKLRDMASEFGNNYSIVQTRQDFTENLISEFGFSGCPVRVELVLIIRLITRNVRLSERTAFFMACNIVFFLLSWGLPVRGRRWCLKNAFAIISPLFWAECSEYIEYE